jgi:hypothetical protein
MRINRSLSSGVLATAMLALLPHTASAWSPKLEVNENTWVQLGYLHQFWFETVEDRAADGSDSTDFFTRRNRFMLLGQAAEKVHFFLNYDAASGGATGSDADGDNPVLTDAMIDFRIMTEFTIVVGRQLVPFSIDNQSSAVTLLGIDYPTRALANQPTVSTNAFWRDDGISVRGLLADGKVDYRAGYFRGDRNTTRNPGGDGRYTAMVMFNLAQSQGWFFNPNSLGALDVLSFGMGYDRMNRGDGNDDHKAWSVFGMAEKKLAAGHLSANAAYYDWEGVVGGFGDGNSFSLAVGFLPEGAKWQPVVRWQQQDPDSPTGTKLDTVGLGLNYYLSGHRVNIKAEYSIDDAVVSGSKVNAFRVQTQLFF